MITRAFRRAVELVVRAMAEWQGWQTWTPTYGAASPMTFTSVTTAIARYKQIGKTVFFVLNATGTTGGTASLSISFTLPVATNDSTSSITGFAVTVDGATVGGRWFNNSTTVAFVRRNDLANWGLGAGKSIQVTGCYEVA